VTTTRPRISACIIARDEAALLARCVASIKTLCDEICVLDTGSRDDTVAVARALDARVGSDATCNGADGRIADFSHARNQSLGLARGEWILQIDADEVLLSGHDALRDAVARDEADVLGVTLRNGEAAWMGTRFFRASAARGYVGRVHERLDYQGRFAAAREVVIENRPDKAGKESSSTRNLRLLRLEVAERPTESRAWYYLGNEERRAGDHRAAIHAYEKSMEFGNHGASRFHAPYNIAVCCFLDGRYADALQAVDRALQIDPRYGEGHCLRGDAWLMLGDRAAAMLDYERALALGGPPADAVFAVTQACYGEYPARRLAELRAPNGHDQQAGASKPQG
jgi:glycosyltransferase involved in cell wall biosynthesis